MALLNLCACCCLCVAVAAAAAAAQLPLLLPSGPNLTKSDILLVELPPGFDAEGEWTHSACVECCLPCVNTHTDKLSPLLPV